MLSVPHLRNCATFLMVIPDISFVVKIVTSDPKSRLGEISREVAQKAGEVRGMHPSRREPDRSGQRRPESRYRGWSQRDRIEVDCTCHATHKHTRAICQALRYKRLAFHFPSPYVTAGSGAMCQKGD